LESRAHLKVPTIHTDRLTLRAFEEYDFEPYFEQILGEREVTRWLGGDGQPRTRENAQLVFARLTDPNRDERDRFWVACERTSGELMGHAVLQRLDKTDIIEVGYALGTRWWGKGFATEAARALVDYGFETVALNLIAGVARPENLASRRVLEKAGLLYYGMRRYYEKDLAYYELARTFWERR
jgi:[ribosomal protein S5]-alanine N-acetyltransferase